MHAWLFLQSPVHEKMATATSAAIERVHRFSILSSLTLWSCKTQSQYALWIATIFWVPRARKTQIPSFPTPVSKNSRVKPAFLEDTLYFNVDDSFVTPFQFV